MRWQDVPAFYQSLNQGTICHLALRLLILIACRSSEVRFCHLDEIEGDVWTIPADRMKAGKLHRVPLSSKSQAVIEQAEPNAKDGYIFPNVREGVISDATMSKHMKSQGLAAFNLGSLSRKILSSKKRPVTKGFVDNPRFFSKSYFQLPRDTSR
jgi:integrase